MAVTDAKEKIDKKKTNVRPLDRIKPIVRNAPSSKRDIEES